MGIFAGPAPEQGSLGQLRAAIGDMQLAVGEAILPSIRQCLDAALQEEASRVLPIRVGALRASMGSAQTGATIKLPISCRECGDTLPPGAAYCISCGARL